MSEESAGEPAAMQPGPALPDDPPPSATEGGSRMARLVRTIEGELIPRLLVSLSGSLTAGREGPEAPPPTAAADAAAELARLVLKRDPPRLDRTCLQLITPAAQRLREIWERNECGFDQLLEGLGRLESVIREVSGAPAGEPASD
jgi:hypothetical protein